MSSVNRFLFSQFPSKCRPSSTRAHGRRRGRRPIDSPLGRARVRGPSTSPQQYLRKPTHKFQHMRILAGHDAHIHFTHLSKSSSAALSALFQPSPSLSNTTCHQFGVLDLIKSTAVPLDKVCLLDPKAEKPLSPEDGDGRFEMFLFGVSLCLFFPGFRSPIRKALLQGILGEVFSFPSPPRKCS